MLLIRKPGNTASTTLGVEAKTKVMVTVGADVIVLMIGVRYCVTSCNVIEQRVSALCSSVGSEMVRGRKTYS